MSAPKSLLLLADTVLERNQNGLIYRKLENKNLENISNGYKCTDS